MKSLKKNFIYNLLYQIMIIILPLITLPYISRVLGVEGVGLYSYSYSIVYYFIIFAMSGMNSYGNRQISQVRNEKNKLAKTFKELYFLQIFTCLISLIIYILFMLFYLKDNYNIYLFQSIYIISCFFDINWLFFGLEEFKITIIRNIFIKIISLMLIFIMVKNQSDLLIYIFILSFSTLINQLILWPYVKRIINKKVHISITDVKKHFIPCIKLFLPVIAITIYKVMDKTMLGLITSINEVGYYENAEKVINALCSIMAALGTVMLPRMSNLYSNGQEDLGKKLIDKSINLIMFISFPIMFGLLLIGEEFSILFFGNQFAKSGVLIKYLGITIVLLSWGNVLRTQYLIPKEMDKEYIISAFFGAIINFVSNLILIPLLNSYGACIGTILAELSVVIYQTLKVKRYLPIRVYICNVLQFFIKSIIMFFILFFISTMCSIQNIYFDLIFKIIIGIIIYSILNCKYIKQLINY